MTVPLLVAVLLALGLGFATAAVAGFVFYGLGRAAARAEQQAEEAAVTAVDLDDAWQVFMATREEELPSVQRWRHRRRRRSLRQIVGGWWRARPVDLASPVEVLNRLWRVA